MNADPPGGGGQGQEAPPGGLHAIAAKAKKFGPIVLLSFLAGLAADLAGLVKNVSGLYEFLFPSIGPVYVELTGQTDVELNVSLTSGEDVVGPPRALKPGNEIEFQVPKNKRLNLDFFGHFVEPGRFTPIYVHEKTKTRLTANRDTDGRWKIAVATVTRTGNQPQPGSDTVVRREPLPATTLLRDRPTTVLPASSLYTPTPFDTALSASIALIGIVEVGTPNCWDQVFVTRMFVSVGCVAAGVPGDLSGLLQNLPDDLKNALPAESRNALERLGQARSVAEAQAVIGDNRTIINEALRQLVREPVLQARLRTAVLGHWDQALATMHRLRLRSARAAATLFSFSVFGGPAILRRIERSMSEKPAKTNASEAELLADLFETIEAISKEPRYRVVARGFDIRMQILRTGKGTHGGVSYDLDDLGLGVYDLVTGQSLAVGG
jgi:hypothetical protein